MHEFHLMADLLKKIERIAAENDAKKVTKVGVQLGALAHITPEHFREHFEEGTSGSIADGAKLVIETSDDIDDPQAQDIILQSIDVV